MLLLLPADPMRPRAVDEHWSREAIAARDLGYEVFPIDHDAAVAGSAEEAVRRVSAAGEAVYRGWMMSASAYAGIAAALAGRSVVLRTTAKAYRTAHELPGWIEAFEGLTPTTRVCADFSMEGFGQAARELGPGPAVLRDYVKSAKHDWSGACFVPDLADEGQAWRVACGLLEARGDDATGGFVIRRFVTLTRPEVRTWWVDGHCRLVTPHPDEPSGVTASHPPDAVLAEVGQRLKALGLAFVTVDLAAGDDRWWVVEVGDGQVSDLHADVDPSSLLTALAG